MTVHDHDHRRPAPRPIASHSAPTSSPDTQASALPVGWEARPRFDGGWTLARSGRARQALVIRWATLALATVTGAVFLFGHEVLELVGRGIEPIGLVLMITGLAAIYWLEHRGPAFRLERGRIERRSGLGGRFVRRYESPSLVLTGAADGEGWAVVLRHDHVPEILASGMPRDAALALAAFVARHTGARVDLPESLQRELAEGGDDEAAGSDDALPRTGTHG